MNHCPYCACAVFICLFARLSHMRILELQLIYISYNMISTFWANSRRKTLHSWLKTDDFAANISLPILTWATNYQRNIMNVNNDCDSSLSGVATSNTLFHSFLTFILSIVLGYFYKDWPIFIDQENTKNNWKSRDLSLILKFYNFIFWLLIYSNIVYSWFRQ